ncbi:hemA protein [Pediococcus claussenii]|nr:hemA protein [Pediococcus claussenii]
MGLDYHKTPIKIRESMYFKENQLSEADQMLFAEKSILENVILSTCERTEVYAVVDQVHTGKYYIKRFLASEFGIAMDKISEYLNVRTGEQAVYHLMELTCGLDSPDIGEPHILGQVKNAFFTAQSSKSTGVLFNHLFKQAISFSKWTHYEYKINEYGETSTQIGLHAAKTRFNKLEDRKLLIVGAGDMAKQVLQNASGMGFESIQITNRSLDHAKQLADLIEEEVLISPITQLQQEIAAADIIVTAWGGRQQLIEPSWAESQGADLNEKVFIDLGLPRNIEFVSNFTDFYYDLDHLANITTKNHDLKLHLVKQVKAKIPDQVEEYFLWQKQLNVVPLIRSIRERSTAIQSDVYESLVNKLPELNDHEQKVIRKHMKSIVNQMLKSPIKEIKELSTLDDGDDYLNMLNIIFKRDA